MIKKKGKTVGDMPSEKASGTEKRDGGELKSASVNRKEKGKNPDRQGMIAAALCCALVAALCAAAALLPARGNSGESPASEAAASAGVLPLVAEVPQSVYRQTCAAGAFTREETDCNTNADGEAAGGISAGAGDFQDPSDTEKSIKIAVSGTPDASFPEDAEPQSCIVEDTPPAAPPEDITCAAEAAPGPESEGTEMAKVPDWPDAETYTVDAGNGYTNIAFAETVAAPELIAGVQQKGAIVTPDGNKMYGKWEGNRDGAVFIPTLPEGQKGDSFEGWSYSNLYRICIHGTYRCLGGKMWYFKPDSPLPLYYRKTAVHTGVVTFAEGTWW